MKVRELRKEDVRDAVRILTLSFERELFGIFKDLEYAKELFFDYFSRNTKNCFVAEEGRIIGFAFVSFKPLKIGKFLRERMGFVKGTKTSLLISYLCPKPKKDEAVINFIAVSPLRREQGAGSRLLERIIDEATDAGKSKIKCLVSVENDAGIALLTRYNFTISKMLDNSFAEKNFGQRKWYQMELQLRR
jgi:ribosomal protein S18 acetylase RimI-like enzyme